MQGQLEGPAEAYFIDGETEGYRDGRFSFKFTQQVVEGQRWNPYALLHMVGPSQPLPPPPSHCCCLPQGQGQLGQRWG